MYLQWDVSNVILVSVLFVFFKQKTAYEMRISDWSSDVCSSDLSKLPETEFLIASTNVGRDPFVQIIVAVQVAQSPTSSPKRNYGAPKMTWCNDPESVAISKRR